MTIANHTAWGQSANNLKYWNKIHSTYNLSEKFNFEVLDNMLAIFRNFILKQQHEQPTSHITQQVSAAIAVHLTEAVYCALLDTTIQPTEK